VRVAAEVDKQVERQNIKADVTATWRDHKEWIHLAQDTDQRQALMKTIIKFLVSEKVRGLLLG
jgi:hypothetical protein